jgi:hypothetical protein
MAHTMVDMKQHGTSARSLTTAASMLSKKISKTEVLNRIDEVLGIRLALGWMEALGTYT